MKNRWLVWTGISILYHLTLLLILSQVRFSTPIDKSTEIVVQLIKELPAKEKEIAVKSNKSIGTDTITAKKTTVENKINKNIPEVKKEIPTEQKNNTVQQNKPAEKITVKDIYRPEQNLPDFAPDILNRNNFASAPDAGRSGFQKLSPGQPGRSISAGGGDAGGNGGLSPDAGKMGSGKASADAGGGGFTASRDPGFFQIGQQLLTSDRGNWSAPAGNGGSSIPGKISRMTPGGNNSSNAGNGNGIGISNGNGVSPIGIGNAIAKFAATDNTNNTGYRGENNNQLASANNSGAGRGNGYDQPMQVSSNPRGKITPGAINRSGGSGNGIGISNGNGVSPAGTGTTPGKIASAVTGNGAGFRGDNKIAAASNDNNPGRGNGYDKPAQQISSNPHSKITPGAINRGTGDGNGIGTGTSVSTTAGTGVGPSGGGISDRGGAGIVIAGGFSFGRDIGGKMMPGGNPVSGGRTVVADAPANGGGNGNGHTTASPNGGVTYLAEISGLSKIGKVPSIIEEENLLARVPGKSCTVVIDVQVGSSGQAMNAALVKSTVFNTINNNAIYIARKIEYRPGMKNGIPSPTVIRVAIKYIDGKNEPEIKVMP